MSQAQNSRQVAHDPRLRQRSAELEQLLAHCPEHLFSTDDKEMAPIDLTPETTEMVENAPVALDKAA